jgi:YesN/AraC family two-component response regulator
MFAELLKRENYEVIETNDGRNAIQLYEANQPNLVITDIIMPDKEGIETILDLKKKYPDCKIIAVSGGGRTNAMDNLRSARLLGASLTFEKPFDNKEIIKSISDLINS